MNESELGSYYTLPRQMESAKESNSHAAYATTHLFFYFIYFSLFVYRGQNLTCLTSTVVERSREFSSIRWNNA